MHDDRMPLQRGEILDRGRGQALLRGAVGGHLQHGQVAAMAVACGALMLAGAGGIPMSAGRAARNLRAVRLARTAGAVLMHVDAVVAGRQALQVGLEHRALGRLGDGDRADRLPGAVGGQAMQRGGQRVGRPGRCSGQDRRGCQQQSGGQASPADRGDHRRSPLPWFDPISGMPDGGMATCPRTTAGRPPATEELRDGRDRPGPDHGPRPAARER